MYGHLSVVDSVFAHDRFDGRWGKFGQGYGVRDEDTTILLLRDRDPGWLLVETDSETLQFVRQDGQIDQWLQNVQNDENQVTRPRDGDDLSTSSFSVLWISSDYVGSSL
jgi:hypothetical protein